MGYEYSNRGPGGLSALEATIGADTCGWECDLADGVDGLGFVPTMQPIGVPVPSGWMQPGVPVPSGRMQPIGTPISTGSMQPAGYGSAIPVVPSAYGQSGQVALSACARARASEAQANLERARRCATHTAEGIPIAHTAQSAAACARARQMEAVTLRERIRLCGR